MPEPAVGKAFQVRVSLFSFFFFSVETFLGQGEISSTYKRRGKNFFKFIFYFLFKKENEKKGACAPATGIRQQILRARSSTASFAPTYFFLLVPLERFFFGYEGNKKKTKSFLWSP